MRAPDHLWPFWDHHGVASRGSVGEVGVDQPEVLEQLQGVR